MRRDLKPKTGRLLDTSDLTVAAPIRRGLVPSLDAVSYKTRTERVLRLLQLGRQGLHEVELTRVLADAAERTGLIHSVRIGIIEPQNLLMLSVTFDGDWQPYMRVIWQKVVRLLDLLFCNTEHYVNGWESSYEEWMDWLRRHQVSSPFLYAQPGLSYGDGQLLRTQEWMERGHAGQELAARQHRVQNADLVEDALADLKGRDPRFPGSGSYFEEHGGNYLIVRQSVRSLAALHRLTEVYLPGTPDGWVLHRAAREALASLNLLFSSGSLRGNDMQRRFLDALKWLARPEPALPAARQSPPLQKQLADALPEAERKDVQAGILHALSKVEQGCVLLLGFRSAQELASFVEQLPLTNDGEPFNGDAISVSLALTLEGLRLAGFGDEELRQWPDAFYEGMAQRASQLGDVRANHPRHWRLPPRNAAQGVNAADEHADPRERVELAEVHALLQLRTRQPLQPRQQLWAFVEQHTQPAQRLSVQWLHTLRKDGEVVEHFGWREAQTNPVFDLAKSNPRARDHIHVGEALCGHANAVDARWPAASHPADRWLRNGSFLVLRKLRQDVDALDEAMAKASARTGLPEALLRAKLMGRFPHAAGPDAGKPLVPLPDPARPNDFSFARDGSGAQCPFHAHIRRSNPRQPVGSLSDPKDLPEAPLRPPRLLRRGMSYGPAHTKGDEAERGLFFMAYNASLVEQFEVLQRWCSGANSSGSDSAQSDPLLGVAVPGQDRVMAFEHQGQLQRVVLEEAAPLNEEARALVRLQWGLYAFAPALSVLQAIAARAKALTAPFEPPSWSAQRGEREIAALLALEQQSGADAALQAWKVALEDPESLAEHRASSIWAAIRELHGGQLRCAFGVLVASPEGVAEVLRDAARYSVTGYQARMQNSFGPIFLGFDAGQSDQTYERESAEIVAAIQQLKADDAYDLARQLTQAHLQRLRTITIDSAKEAKDAQWRLSFELRELLDELLGAFCKTWFGIPDDKHNPLEFEFGGLDLALGANDRPRNPGHFASPSRYFFQPHPNADVARVGDAHGQALRRAMKTLLQRNPPETAQAPLVQAVRRNPLHASDPDYAARTLVGVVMGFVPTVDGTLRRVLAELLREGSFWRLRGQQPALESYADAWAALGPDFIRGMQMRVAPELLWRTAAQDHVLGSGEQAVRVHKGDRVVAGLMSATACRWAQGSRDFHAVFGGDRSQPNAPTHACPGTQAALGLMLGFVAALLETELPLRPGPAPLSFEASGPLERAPAPMPPATKHPTEQREATLELLTLGDSWLALFAGESLTRSLMQQGWKNQWRNNIAFPSWTLTAIEGHVDEVIRLMPDVDLILIDGGGNDVHQDSPPFFPDPQLPVEWATLPQRPERRTLDDLLQGTGSACTLNPDAVRKFIDEHLGGQMKRIVGQLVAHPGCPKIVIVAYDHPIPNGKALNEFTKPWLKPSFERRGVPDALAQQLMKELINHLNQAYAQAVSTQDPNRVRAVDLTGTLGGNVAKWNNELHPTDAGFDELAQALMQKLNGWI